MTNDVMQMVEALSGADVLTVLALMLLAVVGVFGVLGWSVLKSFGQYLESSTQTRASLAVSMMATKDILSEMKQQGQRQNDLLARVQDTVRDTREVAQDGNKAIADVHKALTDGFGDTSRQVAALKDDIKEQMNPVLNRLDGLKEEMQKAQQQYELRERHLETERARNELERKQAFKQVADDLERVRKDFREQFEALMVALKSTEKQAQAEEAKA